MKIFVSVRHTQEIIHFEVEAYNTIKNIKAKFLEEAQIPNDRGLQFAGILLENNRTVSSYNIKDGSQLVYHGHVSDRLLGGTHIFVKPGKHSENRIGDGKPVFRVPVKLSDKIGDVLAKFLNKRGSPYQIEEHQLIYGGEELENSRTLADYNITNGSLVYWVRFRGRFKFFVRTLAGTTFSLSGDASDTIANVKGMLYVMEETQIPPHEQRILFCGNEMHDNTTLFDSGIGNYCTFQLIIINGGGHPRSDGNADNYVGNVKNEAVKDTKNKEEKDNGAEETEKENKKEDLESKKDDVENTKEDEENEEEKDNETDTKNKEVKEDKKEDKENEEEKDNETDTENKEEKENKKEDLEGEKNDVDNKGDGTENKKEDVEIKEKDKKESEEKETEKEEPPTRKRKADSQGEESVDHQRPDQCVIC